MDAAYAGAVARELVEWAEVRGQVGRVDEEIAVYEEVGRLFGDAAEPEVRAVVATALANKEEALGKPTLAAY